MAADTGKVKLDEALEAGAQKTLSLCPCCQVQLRVTVDKKGLPIEVQDLAHFAAATFGYTFPDPNPEVRKQWAVFDAFIKLLTPQGFADLMGTMWPNSACMIPIQIDSAAPLFVVLNVGSGSDNNVAKRDIIEDILT